MANKLGSVAAMGALGGAINAALCFLKLPVPVGDTSVSFSWPIIPAGAAHGALLAVACMAGWAWLRTRRPMIQWIGLPVLGWVCGWVSFMPLRWYIAATFSGLGTRLAGPPTVREVVFWPLGKQISWEALVGPLQFFGFVGAAYGLLSLLAARSGKSGREVTVAMFCAAGVLGSLWWWIDWQPWYFSLIHGTLWGFLVGTGAWHADQPSRAPSR